ncbi:MAG: hypothetical protein AUI14_03875 [Actinobacteria bacterium 13_2_20CM_2_71_6]|nr:MAG: hypothetical protein AUI14_03875 [Actinobacteria bacterium 13_2_20CM_2_71_6]
MEEAVEAQRGRRQTASLLQRQQLVQQGRRDVRLVAQDHHRPVHLGTERGQARAQRRAHSGGVVVVDHDPSPAHRHAGPDRLGGRAQHDHHLVQP